MTVWCDSNIKSWSIPTKSLLLRYRPYFCRTIYSTRSPTFRNLAGKNRGIRLPASDKVITSLRNFVSACTVIGGTTLIAMSAAKKSEASLTSSSEGTNDSNSHDGLLTRIEEMLDRKLDDLEQRMKKHTREEIEKFGTHNSEELRKLSQKIEWRDQQQRAQRRNSASAQVQAAWIPVISHLDGRDRSSEDHRYITSMCDVMELRGPAVQAWLALYGLEAVGALAEQKETLVHFLSGALS
ncbi:hypothetical protein IAU59_004124 [Kwoniella sp. CBS 9459]